MIELKFRRVASDDSYTASTPVMVGGTGYAYRITHRDGVWLATYRHIGDGVTASPVKYWPVDTATAYYRTKRDAVAAAHRHADTFVPSPGVVTDNHPTVAVAGECSFTGGVFTTADMFGWVDQNDGDSGVIVFERTRSNGTKLSLSCEWVHDTLTLTYDGGGWLTDAVASRDGDHRNVITAREGMSLDDTVTLALSAPIADDVLEVLMEHGVDYVTVGDIHHGYWDHDDAVSDPVGWFRSSVRVTVPAVGIDDVVTAVGTIDGWVATVSDDRTNNGHAVIIVTAK